MQPHRYELPRCVPDAFYDVKEHLYKALERDPQNPDLLELRHKLTTLSQCLRFMPTRVHHFREFDYYR